MYAYGTVRYGTDELSELSETLEVGGWREGKMQRMIGWDLN